MANQGWVSLINGASTSTTGQGTALNTAATATLSPTTGIGATNDVAQVNAPGNYLGWAPGMIIRVTARGILTTTTTSTTATIFLASNKVSSSSYVTLATAVGITTGTTAITGIQWIVEAILRCTGTASSGNTVSTQGELRLGNSGAGLPANPIALTATPGMVLPMPNSAGETAVAVDTTQAQFICLRGTLAGANATLQCNQWLVEALD